jgi:CheY-like chemotaxis protein
MKERKDQSSSRSIGEQLPEATRLAGDFISGRRLDMRKSIHDLRNALSVVLGNIQMLAPFVEKKGGPDQKKMFTMLNRNAERMKLYLDSMNGSGKHASSPGKNGHDEKYGDVRFTPKKILIVDDEPDFAETAKQILEQEGHSVGKAFSGAQGLRNANNYNMLVLDLRMPKMSGYEVLKKMKKANIKVPVIVITGLEMPDAMKEKITSAYPGTKVISKTDIRRLPEEVRGGFLKNGRKKR